jgi:pilus assembly protein CpaF
MTFGISTIRARQGNGAAGTPTMPPANETEFQQLKTGIHRELLDAIDLSQIGSWDEVHLREQIRNLAESYLQSSAMLTSDVDQERLVDELIAESFGLGPLEPYLHDPDVTDILVNGPHEVFVERFGRLQPTNTVFADEQHLMQIIGRVVSRVGRRVDEQSPMVDARLPDGSRVNAVIPPLALNGPVLSIRRFGRRALALDNLIASGSICSEMVALLRAAVEGRINIMISGGTGAGKTTLLNCLSQFIPDGERLVTIEDAAELQLRRRHVVKLETRPPNTEGRGEVTQRDLMKNALRMRPDRIILGEVRGGEALDMLQAMNTGHEGSLTTIHANDTSDALSRLEVMVSMAGFEFAVPVVRRYVASALTLVVHVARLKGGLRKVTRVSEIVGLEEGDYQLRNIFEYEQRGIDREGSACGTFRATGAVPRFMSRLHEVGISLDPELFQARELKTVND